VSLGQASGGRGPKPEVHAGKLRKVKARELVLRFAFGAAISVVAGLVSLATTSTAGGMFLAFPAILPATITLIERKEDTGKAVHDLQGAVLGALGLVVFAIVARVGFEETGSGVALLEAGGAWAGASILGYLIVETIRRRVHTARDPDDS
jgi:MFS family permease